MAITRAQLPKTTEKKRKKVSKVMREYKKGKLNIGKSKKKVKNRKQAIAIALNEAGIKQKRRRK
jgi:N-acetylglucosamine kinase-like BadF-type ATPase